MPWSKKNVKNYNINSTARQRQYTKYSTEMLDIAVTLVKCKKTVFIWGTETIRNTQAYNFKQSEQVSWKSHGHPTLINEDDEKSIAETINITAEFGCPVTILGLRILVYHYLEKNDKSLIFQGKMPG